MPTMIWDHTAPINGVGANLIVDEYDITPGQIVALWGQNPPVSVAELQPFDPSTGQPWTSEASALAWGQALDNRPAPPPPPAPPTPEAPPAPPTLEHLATEITALQELCTAQQVMIDDLVGMLLDPAASMAALEEPPI